MKKARPKLGDKELGAQLIEDIARYRSSEECKVLVCFVYDPDSRIRNPSGIANDLAKSTEKLKFELIVSPHRNG